MILPSLELEPEVHLHLHRHGIRTDLKAQLDFNLPTPLKTTFMVDHHLPALGVVVAALAQCLAQVLQEFPILLHQVGFLPVKDSLPVPEPPDNGATLSSLPALGDLLDLLDLLDLNMEVLVALALMPRQLQAQSKPSHPHPCPQSPNLLLKVLVRLAMRLTHPLNLSRQQRKSRLLLPI